MSCFVQTCGIFQNYDRPARAPAVPTQARALGPAGPMRRRGLYTAGGRPPEAAAVRAQGRCCGPTALVGRACHSDGLRHILVALLPTTRIIGLGQAPAAAVRCADARPWGAACWGRGAGWHYPSTAWLADVPIVPPLTGPSLAESECDEGSARRHSCAAVGAADGCGTAPLVDGAVQPPSARPTAAAADLNRRHSDAGGEPLATGASRTPTKSESPYQRAPRRADYRRMQDWSFTVYRF
jgi:hypothetical protein